VSGCMRCRVLKAAQCYQPLHIYINVGVCSIRGSLASAVYQPMKLQQRAKLACSVSPPNVEYTPAAITPSLHTQLQATSPNQLLPHTGLLCFITYCSADV
jgi:hypothetical protein